ncbi:Do family serine endopeptidase [Acidimangrovimonas sediminis]|uniref:Do family serine endopeptidase n=1 Tax=Acidimangrovimonas sediminis TaxID=2056283 RepID=UPI001E594AC6|nr:Do family serine endopeptidase [Acidimangrovimonas sediminis]
MQNLTAKQQPRRRMATLALAAALASSGAVTAMVAAPTASFAEPAGGWANLVQQVSPSVVYIEVTENQKKTQEYEQQNSPDFPFQEFSKRFGIPMPDMPQQQVPQGSLHGVGSGFIISPDGYIVTNNHVVDGASNIKVKMTDGREFTAKVIGRDPGTDVALIKVQPDKPLPYVKFGSSSKMRVGDDVMAVGNPFGLGGTVTTGIISAKARDIGDGIYGDFLQTDAAINKGNSGGPLFNQDGQVIGMNTAIISPTGGSVGIGFSVPSDLVQKIVSELKDHGKVSRGWLGVQIQQVSPDVAAALGMDKPQGAMIAQVMPDSPAAKAGFKRGDIITKFGSTEIKSVHDLPRAVAMTEPNTKTDVQILRGGKPDTIHVDVGQMKQSDKKA